MSSAAVVKLLKSANKYQNKPTVRKVAKKVNKLASKVNKVNELKYFDVNTSSTSVDWSGTVTTYNVPAQGDTGLTRDGDIIDCMSFDLNMMLEPNSGNAATFRVLLIWDKFNTLGTSVGNVLANTGNVFSVISPYNKEYRKNYVVLHDQSYVMDSINKSTYILKKHFKLNKQTIYNAGTTTIRQGALKLAIISNKIAGATAPLYIQTSRLNFMG